MFNRSVTFTDFSLSQDVQIHKSVTFTGRLLSQNYHIPFTITDLSLTPIRNFSRSVTFTDFNFHRPISFPALSLSQICIYHFHRSYLLHSFSTFTKLFPSVSQIYHFSNKIWLVRYFAFCHFDINKSLSLATHWVCIKYK